MANAVENAGLLLNIQYPFLLPIFIYCCVKRLQFLLVLGIHMVHRDSATPGIYFNKVKLTMANSCSVTDRHQFKYALWLHLGHPDSQITPGETSGKDSPSWRKVKYGETLSPTSVASERCCKREPERQQSALELLMYNNDGAERWVEPGS